MAEQTLKEKTAKGLFWGGLSNGVQQVLNLVFGLMLARILDASTTEWLECWQSLARLLQRFKKAALLQHLQIKRKYGMRIIMPYFGLVR